MVLTLSLYSKKNAIAHSMTMSVINNKLNKPVARSTMIESIACAFLEEHIQDADVLKEKDTKNIRLNLFYGIPTISI
ncbi:MAG: hypothetical protein BWX99_00812 [Deltaproteobacteria bacterium ADurb.Bin151]|nr:MAG: hypothetical protein BWX99_00812 [Deltaproteobacteria bacterium ADurb.Bin151]